jgi:hypothetical protein
MIAYDSACSYAVNIKTRFSEHIPDLQDTISRTRFVIDSLHIHDHIDKCMYTHSTAYQEHSGHFHGVGVEQFWSVQNQSGPKTSQMNSGHRADSITGDIGDWNWKKTVRLGKFWCSSTSPFLITMRPQQIRYRRLSNIRGPCIPRRDNGYDGFHS